MSVINRMLQELESRHEQPQDKLPGIVRAVPPPARSRRKLATLAVTGAALLAGAAFWVWQSMAPQDTSEAVPIETPASAPAPITKGEPAVSTPEAVWPQPLAAPTEALVSETALAPQPPDVKPDVKPSGPAATAAVPEPPPRQPRQQGEAALVKAVPDAFPEAVAPAGIKQISAAQRADQRYREALTMLAQGRMGEAQAALEEVLRTDARHLGARQALLGIFVDGKRFVQAEQLLQEGLALDLAPASLAMALARLQMERGDQQAALATLDRHLAQGQGSADYAAFLAALLQRAGRHGEAASHYQTALRLQPNRAVWWMGLGISLQAEKRGPEAAQAFERARKLPGLTPELQAFVDQRLKQLQQQAR